MRGDRSMPVNGPSSRSDKRERDKTGTATQIEHRPDIGDGGEIDHVAPDQPGIR